MPQATFGRRPIMASRFVHNISYIYFVGDLINKREIIKIRNPVQASEIIRHQSQMPSFESNITAKTTTKSIKAQKYLSEPSS